MKSIFRLSTVVLRNEHFLRVNEGSFFQTDGQVKLEFQILKAQEQIEKQNEFFSNIEISLPTTQKVSDLGVELSKHLANPTLYTVDRSLIANVTTLEQLMREPFYILTETNQLYFVQNKAGHTQDEYRYLKAYFEKMKVPLLERKIMVSYLIRLDSLMELNFGTKLFQDTQTLQKSQLAVNSVEKSKLIQAMLDAFPDKRNTQSDHENELFQSYFKLKNRHDFMRQQRKVLLEQAAKRTQLQMLGGLGVLIGHFCFMASGIYVYYDWDVMEPIGYFLNTGGAIYISYQYFKRLNAEWTHSRLSKYLIDKNYRKLCGKSGFDHEGMENTERELQEIRNRIKTNLIINL